MYNVLVIVSKIIMRIRNLLYVSSYYYICVVTLAADFAALLLVILDVIAMQFSVLDPLPLLLLS